MIASQVKDSAMKATDRNALIQTLREYQRSLEHLVSTLDHSEQEAMALVQSAAQSIKSAVERLKSSNEAANARTAGR
jgi:DNA integrity scanning protein DisA with diadenylate cyclase activity